MDTLKSYFSKILQTSAQRTGHSPTRSDHKHSPRVRRPDSDSQTLPIRSHGGHHSCTNGTLPKPDGKVANLAASFELKQTQQIKSPAPSKPPRKDQIFSVEFLNVKSDQALGIELDYAPSSFLDNALSNGHTHHRDHHSNSKPYISSPVQNFNPLKIVSIRDGSVARAEGRLKVGDEIIDINGRSLVKISRSEARLMLASAIRSGQVVMTIRRRRKKPAPPPPLPIRQSSVPDAGAVIREARIRQTASQSTLQQIDDADDSVFSSNNTLNTFPKEFLSISDLTTSSEDIFSESKTFNESASQKTYVNLAQRRQDFLNSPAALNNGEQDSRIHVAGKDRTQSTSAVEDELQWTSVSVENSPIRSNHRMMNGSSVSGSTNSLDTSENQNGHFMNKNYDSAVRDSNFFRHKRSVVGSAANRSLLQRKLMKPDANRPGTDSPIGSMSPCESITSSTVSSPIVSGKRRMVSKMHLLKDANGLGIHIAGGRGSRKGDIGIFIAGVTEGGPAHRHGRLKRGDELLMINGKSLINLTHQDAVEVLRTAPRLVQLVVASKVRKSASIASTPSPFHYNNQSSTLSLEGLGESRLSNTSQSIPELLAQTPSGSIVKWDDVYETFSSKEPSSPNKTKSIRYGLTKSITVMKGAGGKGLGFTIVGGEDTAKGKIGIHVKRIFATGLIAEEGSINEGDEILELNSVNLDGLSHQDVLTKFRQLKRGPVTLTYRRRLSSPMSSPHRSPQESREGSPVSTPRTPRHTPQNSISSLQGLNPESPRRTMCMSSSTSEPQHLGIPVTNGGRHSQPENMDKPPTQISKNHQEHNGGSLVHSEQLVEIILYKEVGVGLGIGVVRRIMAGVSNIYIQEITQGSPAESQGLLRVGDLVLEVNGKRLRNAMLLDAYQVLRSLQPGPVRILVKRDQPLKDANLYMNTLKTHLLTSPATRLPIPSGTYPGKSPSRSAMYF